MEHFTRHLNCLKLVLIIITNNQVIMSFHLQINLSKHFYSLYGIMAKFSRFIYQHLKFIYVPLCIVYYWLSVILFFSCSVVACLQSYFVLFYGQPHIVYLFTRKSPFARAFGLQSPYSIFPQMSHQLPIKRETFNFRPQIKLSLGCVLFSLLQPGCALSQTD